MADYFTKLSFAISLPPDMALEVVDYVDALYAAVDGDEKDAPKGWPDPTEVVDEFNNDVGFLAILTDELLPKKKGDAVIWVRDDGGAVNVDLLIFVLERTWEKFKIQEPIGFQWSNDSSKPRLDAYGGGFVVVGCDASGKAFSDVQNTSSLMRRALAIAGEKSKVVDQWAMRAIGSLDAGDDACVIRKHDGGWVEVTADTFDPKDSLPLSHARVLSLPSNSLWCRVDFLDGPVVPGEVHSDDNNMKGAFDARPWLALAHPDEISDAAQVGWSYAEEMDRVAYALEGMGEPATCRVMDYVGLQPTMPNGDAVGFGIYIDGPRAMAWLEEHRPDVHARVQAETDPAEEPGI